jgi:hypothetical protein
MADVQLVVPPVSPMDSRSQVVAPPVLPAGTFLCVLRRPFVRQDGLSVATRSAPQR